MDTVTLGVMSSRLDGIVREMTNTMVRTARSTTMASRDFSCSVTDANHDMVSSPDGALVHVYGSSLLAEAMGRIHPGFVEGDAFLSNDPYDGNSHAADHTILVPVFYEGEHVFTALAKAHQADCGNALPTTYSPTATDVYNEGALIFPCVKVQSGYQDNTDIIRMCERRIRAYDIWRGDFLATIGAARLAERRLKEFCTALGGAAEARAFVAEWLDYSEKMTAEAIAELPAARVTTRTQLDPFPGLPEGLPLQAEIDIDPVGGNIVVDLRDNPDCVPNGLNLSESTSRNAATAGVLVALNSERDAKRVRVPNNAGAYRRIRVQVRENCVVGIPRHPASASCATTTVQDRVVGMTMVGMALAAPGRGAAEPTYGSGPFQGVSSGLDPRRDDEPFVFQTFLGTAGGPATSQSDGWLTYQITGASGIGYIDQTEITEQKHPLVVWEKVVRPDSEGAGRTRGAPGGVAVFGPRLAGMTCHYFLDGVLNRPLGVRGGGSPLGPEAWHVAVDGAWTKYEHVVGEVDIEAGETIASLSAGGGGYGSPLERDPALVLEDVIDDYVTVERARSAYGVVLSGDAGRWETLTVDADATAALRAAATDPEGGRVACGEPAWWA
ncbi:MAG: hydantoinase B/oxoprolinase family protein [Solirubrobacteraceae bacterium]|nr:hydantoinase B/oxoprolinase family protein [Solirubrobacteraceae bacterium]